MVGPLFGFAQSMDCPALSSDGYLAGESMDLLRISYIVDCSLDTLPAKSHACMDKADGSHVLKSRLIPCN